MHNRPMDRKLSMCSKEWSSQIFDFQFHCHTLAMFLQFSLYFSLPTKNYACSKYSEIEKIHENASYRRFALSKPNKFHINKFSIKTRYLRVRAA